VLRPDLLVSPSKTAQSRRYYNNAPIKGLDNSATRINIGCTIGVAGVESLHITCQRGDQHLFIFPIDTVAAMPMPVPEIQTVQPAISITALTLAPSATG
jgi:hypothetical protein